MISSMIYRNRANFAGGPGPYEEYVHNPVPNRNVISKPSPSTSLYMMLLVCAAINLDQLVAAPNLSQIATSFNMTPSQKDSRLGALTQFGFYMTAALFSILSVTSLLFDSALSRSAF